MKSLLHKNHFPLVTLEHHRIVRLTRQALTPGEPWNPLAKTLHCFRSQKRTEIPLHYIITRMLYVARPRSACPVSIIMCWTKNIRTPTSPQAFHMLSVPQPRNTPLLTIFGNPKTAFVPNRLVVISVLSTPYNGDAPDPP